jgi:hypothetical protein
MEVMSYSWKILPTPAITLILSRKMVKLFSDQILMSRRKVSIQTRGQTVKSRQGQSCWEVSRMNQTNTRLKRRLRGRLRRLPSSQTSTSNSKRTRTFRAMKALSIARLLIQKSIFQKNIKAMLMSQAESKMISFALSREVSVR